MNDTIFNGTTPSRMQERVEVVKKAQQEYRLIGQVKSNPGHVLFEYNTVTHTIRRAEIRKEIILKQSGLFLSKTTCEVLKDCIYLQALNIKNAAKKLRKSGFEVKGGDE